MACFGLLAGICLSAFTSPAAWRLPVDRAPTTNSVPWLGLAGVPGGIPERDTIFENMVSTLNPKFRCVADGTSDCTAAIAAAINACPPGGVLYFPAGKYLITGRLYFPYKSRFTVRGDGPRTEFICKTNGASGVFEIGTTDYPRPVATYQVLAGAEKGSQQLTLNSAAGISVGKLLRIEQQDPDYVFVANGKPAGGLMSMMHLVTGVYGNIVTVMPPLVMTLTNKPAVAPHKLSPIIGVGFENLKIDMTESPSASAFYFAQVWGCWVKNVEITGSDRRQIWWIRASACETRDSYMHGLRSFGPNHEGVALYGDGCWNLIENNVMDGITINIGDWMGGCAGNVVSYNFGTNMLSGSRTASGFISFNHAPHNVMNLAEGNIGQMIRSDGYYGSASHNTIFRNAFSGNWPGGESLQRCISLERWSYWFTIAGNVLGIEGKGQLQSSEVNGEGRPLIYRFGYPNMGNSSYNIAKPGSIDPGALDLKVKDTLLLVNNYDWSSRSIENPVEELPASLYLTAQPAWWGAGAWPPIGPNKSPMLSLIPAQARYLALPSLETPPGDATIRKGLPPTRLRISNR